MFKKLKQKWGVNGWNMALIISTFALGGSACARVAGFLLKWSGMEKNLAWWFFYIILVSFLWPVCVIMISFPLGQFRFFQNYLLRIWGKLSRKTPKNTPKKDFFDNKLTKIAIFASGKGTNANNIISYFKLNQIAQVSLIITDNPAAGVIEIASKHGIPTLVLSKNDRKDYSGCQEKLAQLGVNLIVLAGYLKKIPESLIRKYPESIINIHPALLPKYGGKGMYGGHVHQAVLDNHEAQSGITIHYVDEIYDHGKIIFQDYCTIASDETPATLAEKIHELEYMHYPKVIASLIQK